MTLVGRGDAGIRITCAKDSVDTAAVAGACALFVDGSDIDKGAYESDIQDDCKERGECKTCETAYKKHTEGGIDDADAADAGHRTKICGLIRYIVRIIFVVVEIAEKPNDETKVCT